MYDKFPVLVQHDLAIIYLKLPVQDPMISATSFFHVKFKSWYIGLNWMHHFIGIYIAYGDP